ncbi:phage tail tape measure protein [Chromobacterium vaccinii]|uniref:phage tail tape measure protein n=1 Tax=Chromobacterium vaccinii TaxID=1108595 RepID=UPI001E5B3E3E|nr:phage tail tape measure protein [Chromobacterium vaccinii]MCD4483746.1 phage tail tape measure protein [Chromobacterium vaccinii]
MTGNKLDLMVRIQADAAQYARGLSSAGRETRHFADQARHDFASLKGHLAALGLQIGAVGTALKGLNVAGGLESAMLNVEGNIKKATTSASELTRQLQEVRDSARDISKITPFTQTGVVGIQNSLLKAGVSQSAINGRQGAGYAAASLAALTDVAPDAIGDMLARIGSQFRFSDKDYAPAADTLMRGEAASPGNLQEIMYSLRQFGSNANTLKIDIKDSTAAAATLTPLGGEAGTAMNRFLEDSIGKTPMQRKALKALGLTKVTNGKRHSAFFEDGKFIGMERATELVRVHLGAIKDDSRKIALATKAWGEEGARAALIFATADSEHNFSGMKRAMNEAVGSEERMRIKMRGFEMSVKHAKSSLDTLLGTAFTPFLDNLGSAAQQFTNFTNFLLDKRENGGLDLTGEDLLIGGVTIGGLMAALPVARKLGGGKGPVLWGEKSGGKTGGKPGGKAGAVGGALSNLTSLGTGIVTGKVLQQATGITPVYVVNMPDSGPPGGAVPPVPGGPGGVPPIPPVVPPVPSGPQPTTGVGVTRAGIAGTALRTFTLMALLNDLFTTSNDEKEELLHGDKLRADLKKQYGQKTIDAARARYQPWYQFGSYAKEDESWVRKYLMDQRQGKNNEAWFAGLKTPAPQLPAGGDKLAQVFGQNQQVTEALLNQVRQTKIGGTVDVVIHAPPGLQVETRAKPLGPTTTMNVGRTMQGAN